MFSSNGFACCILFLLPLAVAGEDELMFNGFNGSASWAIDGSAAVLPNGILSLNAATNKGYSQSHAFYVSSFHTRNHTDGSIFSFSATFVFAIRPSNNEWLPFFNLSRGGGIAFVLAPTTSFTTVATTDDSFGLLAPHDNGKPSNHVLFVELDTTYNKEFEDIDDNHVGININSLNSSRSSPAGYYTDDPLSDLHTLRLSSGKELQVWIDYDHELTEIIVSLAPVPFLKPKRPLLSTTIDLSHVFLDNMYMGFSSSSWNNHDYFILGCSFNMNRKSASLDHSKLPRINKAQVVSTAEFVIPHPRVVAIQSPAVIIIMIMSVLFVVIILVVRRYRMYQEVREDWEVEFGPHRFSYKDLFQATNGFKDKRLLGAGGFGKVYKGILRLSKLDVAVKVMSHDSKQGMKEFIAEVESMGRLRHRNLVQLLGYCRRKGELLLVYEYMPNGSLDKHLYDLEKPPLDWDHRFEIIKGVASGLLYLHEEWEQVVIHRDVKASNVLLDGEMKAQLGDFGLARLHNHGVEAHTTCVAGTRGYISPELARLGKATKATDVFAFGAFILEVACGRRPIIVNSHGEPQLLVDFILKFWQRDLIVCMMDPRLGVAYLMEEADLVLKLGLLCSHPSPLKRPTMRLVMHYLCGDVPFPELPDAYLSIKSMSELHDDAWGGDHSQCLSVQTSISSLSDGR